MKRLSRYIRICTILQATIVQLAKLYDASRNCVTFFHQNTTKCQLFSKNKAPAWFTIHVSHLVQLSFIFQKTHVRFYFQFVSNKYSRKSYDDPFFPEYSNYYVSFFLIHATKNWNKKLVPFFSNPWNFSSITNIWKSIQDNKYNV